MSWRALSRLLIDGRADRHVVALRQGARIDFARFRTDVASAAARLAGCRSGALLCQDSYAFAVGWFGLVHAGAEIVLPANGQPETLARMQGGYERLIDDEILAPGTAGSVPLGPVDPERIPVAFFTSGSTGAPKRIVRTLGMLEREVGAFDTVWGSSIGQGPVLATVAHQHLYGLSFKVLWPIASGRPFDALTYEAWEHLIGALEPAGTIISSPAHLGRMTGIAPVPAPVRPSAVFSAGAPLPVAAVADARAILGCVPNEIFGSTETGAIATRRLETGDEPWGLLPGVAMRCDEEQRLTITSPHIDGWLETADVVEPVPGGFRFIGRSDRVVKIEGKRVALAEIESALTALPWIDAAAAVVVPGQPARAAAAVVLNELGRQRLAAMGRFRFGRLLRQELCGFSEPLGIPKLWRFIERLPSRAMGKRNDQDVLALFAKPPR